MMQRVIAVGLRVARNNLVLVCFAIISFSAPSAQPAQAPVAPAPAWPRYTLHAEQTWQLNLPNGQPFDASGLLIKPDGEILTINDRSSRLYRIQFVPNTNSADLIAVPDYFTSAQLAKFKNQKFGRYDCEGIAQDKEGRLYICEEADRWILRCDAGTKTVERLAIDWSPAKQYFNPIDVNASFEGIAIGGDRLYVANERQLGRIIAVDLKTLRVTDDFAVASLGAKARDVHYSDLSWFDGALYVLLRESRCVLQVEPESHTVLAEYSFRDMEREPDVLYRLLYPTGNMEGLAVDRDHIWLVTDNNALGRVKYPKDIRPTLFKCKRADKPTGSHP
ncbi:MAG: esterase-like activity of phytase family protein [Verrucomicrobiales bacterium]|nr:esterase-like activity of phytase family protein [Verrucomicrobiales bacterium]